MNFKRLGSATDRLASLCSLPTSLLTSGLTLLHTSIKQTSNLLLRSMSTSNLTSTVPTLHTYPTSWFITGFSDAEACFYIRVAKKNQMKLG